MTKINTNNIISPDNTNFGDGEASSPDGFSFLEYIHNEKLAHKEHRHKHLLQKLLISGAILGIGQLIQTPNLAFFVILLLPPICLVHDIYIFAEHFKVHRIGAFLRSKEAGLPENSLIRKWEKFLEKKEKKDKGRREKFALWGSLSYTVLVVLVAATAPWLIGVTWTQPHYIIYTASVCINVSAVVLVYLVAKLLKDRLEDIE